MNYEKLAEILFPHITKTPDDYEKLYPKRPYTVFLFYSKTKQDTHKIRAAIKNTVSGIMPETVFFWFKIRLPQRSSQLPSAPD